MGRVRAERRLRTKDIATLAPGIHEDGGGLRLVVEPGGSRHWVQRLTVAGKRHSRGLGRFRWQRGGLVAVRTSEHRHAPRTVATSAAGPKAAAER